jgi:hypothetical protein
MSARQVKDEAVQRARRELPEPAAFDTHQAAAYVGLSRKQLEHLRGIGGGPRWIRLGRHCRYLRRDLDTWLEGHQRYENTAQAAQEVSS